jgi:hypothetical protein
MIDRAKYETEQYLNALFEGDLSPFGRLVAKYNGKQISGIRKHHYQCITADPCSPMDPDATLRQSSTGGNAMLGCCDHYLGDGGKARIILIALVTPASITDNTPDNSVETHKDALSCCGFVANLEYNCHNNPKDYSPIERHSLSLVQTPF